MPFRNPILGGTALVRSAINSPGYVAGSTGWAIRRDGSAEFNNATVRGDIINGTAGGLRIELTGENINVYDAAGTLVATVTATGFTAGTNLGSASTPDVQMGLGDANTPGGNHVPQMLLKPADLNSNQYKPGGLVAQSVGVIQANSQGVLTATSPLDTSQAAAAAAVLQMLSRSHDGVADPSLIHLLADIVKADGTLQATGDIVVQGNLYASTPLSVLGKEPWNAMTLANGWTNFGGSEVAAQYRLVASPPNSVQLIGTIKPGTKTDGTVIATLPSGYRPAHNLSFPLTLTGNTAAPLTARGILLTTGDIQITGINLAGLTVIEFSAVLPLDA